MAASLETIKGWLAQGQRDGATHMLVKCDSFGNDSECCYPVYVLKGEDPLKKSKETKDRTMECYSFKVPIASQLSEPRAFHWD